MKKLVFGGALLLAYSGPSQAAVLYDNMTADGFPSYANPDPGGVLFDDVLIPNARSNAQRKLGIKKIEFAVFAPVAGTYRISSYITQLGSIDASGAYSIQKPVHQLFENDFTFTDNQARLITYGDGIAMLFEYNVSHSVTFGGANYNMFFFGLRFGAPLERVGWLTADGPDVNLNAYYEHFPAFPGQDGQRFLLAPSRSSFALRLTGDPVPEPGTLAVFGLALGVRGLVRRHGRR